MKLRSMETQWPFCLLKQMLTVEQHGAVLENHFIKKTDWSDIKPTLHMSPDCLKNILCHLDESTDRFKPCGGGNQEAASNDEPSATAGLNKASTSVSAFRSQCAAYDDVRPPEETDLYDTITAETDKQPPDTNKTASAVSVPVKVKTKKKFMKRICT